MSVPVPNLSSVGGIESILVVRLKALGDIVLSLPVVFALRETFPAARIAYLCRAQYAEALAGATGLDEVLELPSSFLAQGRFALELRRRRFDLALDLLSSPRSAWISAFTGARLRVGMDTGRRNRSYHHVLPRVMTRDGARVRRYTLESNLELTRILGLASSIRDRADREGAARTAGPTPADGGGSADPRWLAIGFPAAAGERDWALSYASSIGGDRSRLVGVVVGSAYQAKAWPERHLVALVRGVSQELGSVPVLIWGPGEEALARRVAAAAGAGVVPPPTGVARLGALVGALAVLVGPDSGPKHVAVIQGVPTITLFGPTDPVVWDPMTVRHRVIISPVECAPCRKKVCEPNRCLAGIPPERVLAEIGAVLASGLRAPAFAGKGNE